MSEQDKIDPRYPAEFQRGGAASGQTATGLSGSASASHSIRVPASWEAAPAFAPLGQPPVGQPPVGQPPVVQPPLGQGGHDADQTTLGFVDPAHEHSEPVEAPRRNPFIIVLWVLSIAMIVGGLSAVSFALMVKFGTYYGDTNAVDIMQLQMATMMADAVGPALISAGLLGLLGLLFWHAHAWRRRRTTLR